MQLRCLLALAVCLCWPCLNAGFAADAKKPLAEFVSTYCVQCHGVKKQNGERRFDTLSQAIIDDDSLVDYQDILDQLNLGEMPPPEAKQPAAAETQRIVDLLTKKIATYHASRDTRTNQAVLRRLNAREYRNTLRDLLHLNVQMFDPAESFPRDQTSEHLDNIGEELVTSSYLLAAYLESADTAIRKALFPLQKPKEQTWTFRDGFRQQPEIDQVHKKTNFFKHMTLYDVIGADKPEGAYGPIHAFSDGVPHDGYYEIRLNAEAVNRIHPYDDAFTGMDRSEPFRLGIVPGNKDVGELHLTQPIEPLLAEIELADKRKWYTARVWLDQGYTPRFTFRNGLMNARSLWSKLIRRYPDGFEKGLKGIVAQRFNAIKFGKLPQIHIHEIQIRGPIYDQWPRQSQRVLLGDLWGNAKSGEVFSSADMRRQIGKFISKSFRRPSTDSEVDRVMKVIASRRKGGRSSLDAYSDGLKSVLCSPNFLYVDDTSDGELTSAGLASRLSYFLWSSMPDDELLELASVGKLKNPKVLSAQVDRLLKDDRSAAFIDGFLGSWLTLRDLGSAPPDRGDFLDYYHYDLGTAMRRETHLFTRHLIKENLSLVNFLDSDFGIVNKRLAELYDIDPPKESGFHLVQLSDQRRGGLLGQASVLTVTANGIDTSPVVRGVWILENLLGTPPTPPPPDVEPLDPDIRGAKTIRDQLKKHRNVATCNECHRKIDPLGFALETFDPIGGWRTKYENQSTIDASGVMANGKSFGDIREFKKILLERKDQFAMALTEKMLSYAIGRHTTASDRPAVDAMVAHVKSNGYGMKDLIKQIVLSEPFRQK